MMKLSFKLEIPQTLAFSVEILKNKIFIKKDVKQEKFKSLDSFLARGREEISYYARKIRSIQK